MGLTYREGPDHTPLEMTSSSHRWSAVAFLLVAITLSALRSAPFLAFPFAYFNSDEGVFGLMAKHLIEGTGFPLYFYGQKYLLAVNAWLAAIPFAIGGVSAFNLKVCSFVLSTAAAPVLMWMLVREAGLSWLQAFVSTLFISLAPVVMSAFFMSPAFASLEAIYYLLIVWGLRGSPIALGLLAPFLMAARTYSLYGLIMVFALQLRSQLQNMEGSWRDRVRAAVNVIREQRAVVIRFLLAFAAGKGVLALGTMLATDYRGRSGPGPSINALLQLPANLEYLLAWYLPTMHGIARIDLSEWGFLVDGTFDARWLGVVFVPVMLACALATVRSGEARRAEHPFFWYLIGVGILGLVAFLSFLQRPPYPILMRYVMVSILLPVGITAWVLRAGDNSWPARAVYLVMAVWSAVQVAAYASFADRLFSDRPQGEGIRMAQALERDGYTVAEYAGLFAHEVSFVSGERVIVDRSEKLMIARHREAVEAAKSQGQAVPVIVKAHESCPDGAKRTLVGKWYDYCVRE
ncbi:MAG: hypothetical protein AAF654_00465 [Myxococcota bacterium]